MWHIWSLAAGVLHAPLYSFPLPPALLLAAAFSLLLFSRRPWASLPACLLLGLAFGSWHLQQKCRAQLPPEFEQQRFDLSFQIVSIPRPGERSQVFLAQVTHVHCQGVCPRLEGRRLRLSWYQDTHGKQHGNQDIHTNSGNRDIHADRAAQRQSGQSPLPPSLQAGQEWRAHIKVRRPRGFVNPAAFDYHAWLLAQDVVAAGYITGDGTYLGQSFAWAARRAAIEARLLGHHASPYRRFWSALLIGEQGAISAADWATLQATGTVHLLVISGLQISLVATWCFLSGALLARVAGLLHSGSNLRLMHHLPPLCACLGAAYYAALAGFSVPTQRALAACLVLMLCRLSGLHMAPTTLLGAAALAVGVLEPFAWMNAGFWLSFLAVALLFYSFGGRGRAHPASSLLRAQWVMFAGLVLPLLLLGQSVSLVSPVANLVAVPVVSLVLVPLLLLATLCSAVAPPVAAALLPLMDWIFGGLWWFLEWVQSWPVPFWWPARPLSGAALTLAVAGVMLVLAPAGLQVRCLGALWLLLALVPRPAPDFLLRATVLDVGQGTAVLLETPNQAWLYDSGPRFSDQFEAGSRIVAPYLRSRGIDHLNLIISHADTDHAGGVEGIVSTFAITRFLYGEPLDEKRLGGEFRGALAPLGEACRAGQHWRQDGVDWQVLWPPDASRSGNNASCTLLLTLPGGRVRLLLPGDIDSRVEAQLLESLVGLGSLESPVDWVLAPHHGSNGSSSLPWVRRLAAQHVVFSAGFNNRYGHPHPRVVRRWEETGARIYNTALDGALIFTWRADGLEVERLRQSRRRLWH